MVNSINVNGFENEFKELLLKNYEEKTIVSNYRLQSFIIDFAIINEKTKEIIAIFELKTRNSFSQQQLSGFNSKIKQLVQSNGMDIPVYFVLYSNESSKRITVNMLSQEIDDNNKKFFVLIETKLPSYNELLLEKSATALSEKLRFQKEQRKNITEALKRLKVISPFISFIIFSIWFYCKKNKIDLTWIDLSFLLASATFVIFPYVKKIDITQFAAVEFRNDEN